MPITYRRAFDGVRNDEAELEEISSIIEARKSRNTSGPNAILNH